MELKEKLYQDAVTEIALQGLIAHTKGIIGDYRDGYRDLTHYRGTIPKWVVDWADEHYKGHHITEENVQAVIDALYKTA